MLCQCWTWCYESAIFSWEGTVQRIINKAGRVFSNLGGWKNGRWRLGTSSEYGGVLPPCKSRVVLHYERGWALLTVLTGLSLGEADVQLWLAEAGLSAESCHSLSNWERWTQLHVCMYMWLGLSADREAQLLPLEKFCLLVPHSAIGILFLVSLVVVMANSAQEKGLKVTQESRQSCLHRVA